MSRSRWRGNIPGALRFVMSDVHICLLVIGDFGDNCLHLPAPLSAERAWDPVGVLSWAAFVLAVRLSSSVNTCFYHVSIVSVAA